MKRKKKKQNSILVIIIFLCLLFGGYYNDEINNFISELKGSVISPTVETVIYSYDLSEIPEYSGKAYVYINDNKPNFTDSDKTLMSFENYSDLDSLGRCGVAYANVSIATMPTTERESIGSVKPSGWHTVKYDNIEGKYLYNRCHLIGYQLTGENANIKNLITCTRYANSVSMLEWENKVATYVRKTGYHVLYRVTPIFEDENLVASGIQMEAFSVEDDGEGISFNVYIYNIQEGIEIDYKTGDSKLIKMSK